MNDIWYVVADDIYHQDSMMFADPDRVMFSGTKEECEQYLALEAGIDYADIMDLTIQYEEMQEPDPRDQSYVDDFGDPCS